MFVLFLCLQHGVDIAIPHHALNRTYPADPYNSYLGYWHPYSDPSDAGGVHKNSGVPNKMFYLLSEGGIHNRIPVSGIGILNAAKLIYETSTNRWDPYTDFLQARNDCIAQAQNDPNMADWADSVQNAWAAVGVGNPVDEPIPSGWTESGENIYRMSGNVGIDTSNPAYKLDVVGIINASGGIKINGQDVLTSESDPQVGTISTNFIPKWNGSQLITGGIFDNGNVGIGTSNPAYKLDVAGIINASGGIKINGQNVLTSESDPQVGTISTNFIPKWNGSQLITGGIFDNGNVGIGTTSPVADLDVYDSGLSQVQIKSSTQNATLTLDSGVNYESGVEFKESNSRKWYMLNYSYGEDQFLLVNSSNYAKIAVRQNGNIGIGFMYPSYSLMVGGDIAYTGGCYDISDKRLKENIVPLTNAIEKISSINGIYFNNISKPEISNGKDEKYGEDKKMDKREVGVIAQEVEEVLPEVVTEDEEGYKAVDYSKFTPLLIEAVKELKKEIELLKTENQTLQNEILQIKEGNGTSKQ
ncbi:MAG: M4 family metallopeptidase [bacterium]